MRGRPTYRRRWRHRWRRNDYEVEDQKLVTVCSTRRLRTAADLAELVACPLPPRFHTGDLAESLQVRRFTAQRIAYCFRQMGTVRAVGKRGNALLYEFVEARKAG